MKEARWKLELVTLCWSGPCRWLGKKQLELGLLFRESLREISCRSHTQNQVSQRHTHKCLQVLVIGSTRKAITALVVCEYDNTCVGHQCSGNSCFPKDVRNWCVNRSQSLSHLPRGRLLEMSICLQMWLEILSPRICPSLQYIIKPMTFLKVYSCGIGIPVSSSKCCRFFFTYFGLLHFNHKVGFPWMVLEFANGNSLE